MRYGIDVSENNNKEEGGRGEMVSKGLIQKSFRR